MPAFGRHDIPRDAEGRGVARHSGGSGEEQSYDQPDSERAREGEDELADDGHRTGDGHADDDTTDDASAAIVRLYAGSDANEQRQGIDGKREQEPAEKPDDPDEKDDVEKDHGGVLRARVLNGRASHHHLGTT